MSTKLPTVIFDLGGVYFTDGTDRAITIISDKYSIDKREVTDIFRGEVGLTYRENKITIEEFWNVAKKRWNIEREPTDKLAQIWHEGYVPIEGVKKIVMQLKKEGIELLYLSGSTKERVEYLESKYCFLQHFKDGVFTFLVGVRKPASAPYQCLLRKASNHSENCILVDNTQKYLVPAIELGMHTILYKDPDNLRIDLKKYGFTFL
jgi:HAD superfamily hydrolase (TIGR01509 family)